MPGRRPFAPWARQGARVAPRPGGGAWMPPDGRRPRTSRPGPVVRRDGELRGVGLRLGRGLGAASLARARRPRARRSAPACDLDLGLPRDRGLAERPGVLGPVRAGTSGRARPSALAWTGKSSTGASCASMPNVVLPMQRRIPLAGVVVVVASFLVAIVVLLWVPCLVSAGRGLRRTGRSPGFGVRRCGPRGGVRTPRRRPRRCRPRTRRTRGRASPR